VLRLVLPRSLSRRPTPLREAIWRSLVRIRSAIGDYDGVFTTFAQC